MKTLRKADVVIVGGGWTGLVNQVGGVRAVVHTHGTVDGAFREGRQPARAEGGRRESFRGLAERGVSNASHEAAVFFGAVPGWRKVAGLSPLPRAGRDAEPGIHESRRNLPAALRVLRLLRTVRMHDWSQGPADECSAAGDREKEKRDDSQRRVGEAPCARRGRKRIKSTRGYLRRCDGE